jgi:hypothetical protein
MKLLFSILFAASLSVGPAMAQGLEQVGCGCRNDGYNRRWEFTVTRTVRISPTTTVSGPTYPGNIVRAYALGPAGEAACKQLEKLPLKETKCGFDIHQPGSDVFQSKTIADVEKETGAVPIPITEPEQTTPPEKCLDISGVYHFDGLKQCSVLESKMDYGVSRGNPYYLPFPVGRMPVDRDFEIVQNGCKEIQINTKGEHLHAFNIPFTSAYDAYVRYDDEGYQPDGFGAKEWRQYFRLSREGSDLRVKTGHWKREGTIETRTSAWSSADCLIRRVK